MSDPDKVIEEAVGKLYIGFRNLRKAQRYQDEYDSMGALMNMLMKDRQHLRETYKVSE